MLDEKNCATIIPNKLYWVSDHEVPKNRKNSFFFCIDDDLQYDPFFSDFGPLNLGMLHQYMTELDKIIQQFQKKDCVIFHYTSLDSAKRVNSAILISAYAIIQLKRTSSQIMKAFDQISPKFIAYRDASYGPCEYRCKMLHVLQGIEYANLIGWYKWQTFNAQDFFFYERIDQGDLTWIIPGKLLAFSSPHALSINQFGNRCFTPRDYLPVFKQLNVGTVIRLNNKMYDSQIFVDNGIKHHDLIFPDGSVPSDEIIQKFLKICEQTDGKAIAVHCKAGLGRTGTLIGCYAMKHYHFPATAFIGYIRVCRPGSILGPQQFFLSEKQNEMMAQGETSIIYQGLQERLNSSTLKRFQQIKKTKQQQSPMDRQKSIKGDKNQAERLQHAKNTIQFSL